MRRFGRVGLVCSLLAALVFTGLVVALNVAHPRDEAGYLDYVHTYGNYNGRPVKAAPSDELLMAAGERACFWLANQSVALWRTDDSRTVDALYRRYEDEVSSTGPNLPRSVAPGAWAFLCPATKELVRPHRIFDSRPQD
jgi:hypothetical protein